MACKPACGLSSRPPRWHPASAVACNPTCTPSPPCNQPASGDGSDDKLLRDTLRDRIAPLNEPRLARLTWPPGAPLPKPPSPLPSSPAGQPLPAQ
mmetsp:Transcript_4421/g.12775  ORF Transcript_4421/g.12775 Transcript_4421/m.12775 type:complete len:95 (+) Transcript_4421:307-591(+)